MNTITPFSLKDTDPLIQHAWPTSKISEEVQKERKANLGQTLTGLGSYWKGRKPLILTRAVLLATLMPATDNREKDIDIFERLMAFDAHAMKRRLPVKKHELLTEGSYRDQVMAAQRPEQMKEDELLNGIWKDVNAHLGTNASSIVELVEQLGVMRFGRTPKVADTFSGSGSIPFEAARIGCDVYASDLNPVACMLTWGSFNIVGATPISHAKMVDAQEEVLKAIDEEILSLGVEHDKDGNRAKVFLYCLETKCPRTGYMVPMAPSWVIASASSKVVAKLAPDHDNRRYDIEIIENASEAEMKEAAKGTVRSGRLYHPILKDDLGIAIKDIRGDYKDNEGNIRNHLRIWEKSDFRPREDDIWQERLYCIQWINGEDITNGKKSPRTWYAAPTEEDLQRENHVINNVEKNLANWQEAGFAPDMIIQSGIETKTPMRTRGWSFWHHLFSPRDLLMLSICKKMLLNPVAMARLLNRTSRLCLWGSNAQSSTQVFSSQALNTLYNWSIPSFYRARYILEGTYKSKSPVNSNFVIKNSRSSEISEINDIYITDPPYADSVQYEELSEFFIAWLRKNPPAPFDQWIWDSRRAVAIKGSDHAFKTGMIEAYKAMTDHLSENGLQIVQFTHQDNGVWADMAQIFWGAGLQVVQDWVVSTETTSELKKGGYVQGTHNIVCRKRVGNKSGYSTDLFGEIDDEVQKQIETMTGFNAQLNSHDVPNIFSDDDLHTAGYAAALRVLTSYTHIDGEDMTVEALRPRRKGEKTIVDTLVDHAAKAAAKALVPQGVDKRHWQTFSNGERFYLKMIDLESTGPIRLELFQRYSTAYQVLDKEAYMASNKANDASMKSAMQFGRNIPEHADFGKTSLVRIILRAIDRVHRDHDVDEVVSELHDLVPEYYRRHDVLVAIAGYVADKRRNRNEDEASAARILRMALQNEKI